MSDLNVSGQHWHFIGILGAGMQELALYAAERGVRISGSDVRNCKEANELARQGIAVSFQQNQPRLDPATDLVVVSQAIGEDNPELVQARRLHLQVVRYPQLLGMLMEGREGVAVAGSHGKSTTASIIAFVMRQAGLDPSFVIGADIPQLGGGAHYGKGPALVVEACEYKRSFLYLRPTIGVVTNVDLEHLDYYYNLEDIQSAFADFAARIEPEGALVVNADDANTRSVMEAAKCKVIRCSLTDADADYTVRKLWRATRHSNYDLICNGRFAGRFHTRLYGMHNVMNSLLAIAACRQAGMEFADIQQALPNFEGAARRLQLLGQPWGVPVLSDYAHHPKEIQATIAATKQMFPHAQRMFCVFQPHQYSRTRKMLRELAGSFVGAHQVLVTDIYAARDTEEDRLSVSALDLVRAIVSNGQEAYYVPDFEDVEEMVIGAVVPGDLVLVMGAGTVWQVAHVVNEGIARKPEAQIAA